MTLSAGLPSSITGYPGRSAKVSTSTAYRKYLDTVSVHVASYFSKDQV